MFFFLIIYFFFIFTGIQYTTQDCPSSLPAHSNLYVYKSSCYDFISNTAHEFNEAERVCEARNGHLVTIPDRETQQFLYNTISRDFHYQGKIWIGLTDQEREQHHIWVDGTK